MKGKEVRKGWKNGGKQTRRTNRDKEGLKGYEMHYASLASTQDDGI